MSKPHRIAFAGFRHPHIFALFKRVKSHPDCEIIASCESDSATRETLPSEQGVNITHTSFEQMLSETDATIVAIGDVYAKRGAMVIAALKAGKHVIADKPLCTSLSELDEISRLAAERKLSVGCQLDLVEASSLLALREVVRRGEIGSPCTITISAQHPLRLGARAAWYFEPGQHGGTINDIGIHIFDLVPWLTGRTWKDIPLVREWNAKASAFPHFKDCAQFYGLAADGLACFADVSYLAPDELGYALPQYWRITVHGTKGMAEISYSINDITVVTDQDSAPQSRPATQTASSDYLQDFLNDITGKPTADGLTTARVLESSGWALKAQQIASAS